MPTAPSAVITPTTSGTPPDAPDSVVTPTGAGAAPDAPGAVLSGSAAGGDGSAGFTVSGATDPTGANGFFDVLGTANGKATFNFGIYVFRWTGTAWQMDPGDGVTVLFSSAEDVATPALVVGAWTEGTGTGELVIVGLGLTPPSAPISATGDAGAPDAPDAVVSPTAGGSAPDAAEAVISPSSGGGAPTSPGEVVTPSTAAAAPQAPGAIIGVTALMIITEGDQVLTDEGGGYTEAEGA